MPRLKTPPGELSRARLDRRLSSIVRPVATSCATHAPGETGYCSFSGEVGHEEPLYSKSTVDTLVELLREAQVDITHLTSAYRDAAKRAVGNQPSASS